MIYIKIWSTIKIDNYNEDINVNSQIDVLIKLIRVNNNWNKNYLL